MQIDCVLRDGDEATGDLSRARDEKLPNVDESYQLAPAFLAVPVSITTQWRTPPLIPNCAPINKCGEYCMDRALRFIKIRITMNNYVVKNQKRM
jgi:hypothetical protein